MERQPTIEDAIRAHLPAIKEALEALSDYFHVPPITPGMNLETIMYDAGRKSVITDIRTLVARLESERSENIIEDI